MPSITVTYVILASLIPMSFQIADATFALIAAGRRMKSLEVFLCRASAACLAVALFAFFSRRAASCRAAYHDPIDQSGAFMVYNMLTLANASRSCESLATRSPLCIKADISSILENIFAAKRISSNSSLGHSSCLLPFQEPLWYQAILILKTCPPQSFSEVSRHCRNQF